MANKTGKIARKSAKPATTIKTKAKKAATPDKATAKPDTRADVPQTEATEATMGAEATKTPKKTKQQLRDEIKDLQLDLETAQGSLKTAGDQMGELAKEVERLKGRNGNLSCVNDGLEAAFKKLERKVDALAAAGLETDVEVYACKCALHVFASIFLATRDKLGLLDKIEYFNTAAEALGVDLKIVHDVVATTMSEASGTTLLHMFEKVSAEREARGKSSPNGEDQAGEEIVVLASGNIDEMLETVRKLRRK